MKHRLIPALALVLGLAACSSGTGATQAGVSASGPGGAPKEIRIGYQLIPNGDLIVKDQRWLEEALPDTTITWTKFDSGGDVNTAMVAGSIDIGLAGSAPVTRGLSAPLDIPYKVPWIFDVIGENEALVARQAGSVQELKGKKVAAPFSSTAHYSLLAALQDAGLAEADVTVIDLEPPDIQAAWARGDIDAAYTWTPVLGELRKTGKVLVTSKDLAAKGKLTADLAVVRDQFATTYPEALRTWLAQQDRAVKLVRSDKQAAAAAVGRQLNLDPAEAAEQIDELVLLDGKEQAGPDYLGTPEQPGALAQNLRSTAEFLRSQNKLPSVPELTVFQQGLATEELRDAFAG
ncbi:taurine ABC transporter substrate-binding protein [Nonomuraea cavernae]|uniref:Glycine/betaine ABC transporter substrate-binding protein n=1 Tax=Nonomuraea cavernae TaxID=2045107 RepID=A0A917YVU0_9ACTN|nr:glycine betaine ABC transporter substrate-binding protein [Nonomuraea cavernae]MCA2185572.1 ABC transporter substrate-binding protein [Nonomuraea cavernae]GGO66873.1 glycine/betaine ABC transporter substrate-binding protein [Nonomuraea cavernae]